MKKAHPNESSGLGLFGDETSTTEGTPGQADAVTSPAARLASITVGPVGVAEPWLLKQLGLSTAQVHPLHGDVIGAPRDYCYRGNCYHYTAAGVARLARHFGISVDVFGGGMAARSDAMATAPRHPQSKRWDLEERP